MQYHRRTPVAGWDSEALRNGGVHHLRVMRNMLSGPFKKNIWFYGVFKKDATRLLGAPGLTTRSKDATTSSAFFSHIWILLQEPVLTCQDIGSTLIVTVASLSFGRLSAKDAKADA